MLLFNVRYNVKGYVTKEMERNWLFCEKVKVDNAIYINRFQLFGDNSQEKR